MSLQYAREITCWKCRAANLIKTDGNGRLVETKGACICKPVEVRPKAKRVPVASITVMPNCMDCGAALHHVKRQRCNACRDARARKDCLDRYYATKGPNALSNLCEKCGAPCRRKMCLPCSNLKHAAHNQKGKPERDREIIRRLEAGENPRVVALDYDLSAKRVKQIKDRAA